MGVPSQTGHLLRGTLELLLLQALEPGPSHGYGIARHIQRATGDALAVEEGSLYPALYRLEQNGMVAARWTTAESGRSVREYRITGAGRKQLAAKRRDWQAFVKAMSRMVKVK
jgi:transcriptional regulator